MRLVAIMFCLAMTHFAVADDGSRNQKIAEILKAQGLYEQIALQLEAQKKSTIRIGEKIFAKAISERDLTNEKYGPKLKEIFRRFMERGAGILTADELLGIVASHYGKNLSDRELDEILAYYKSPIGQKDVSSTKAAMEGFVPDMMNLYDQKLTESIKLMESELNELSGPQ